MPDRNPIHYPTLDDVPSIVMSEGTMLWNRTGSWRYMKPVYRQMTPPCNNGCPAGNNIEGFIRLADEKDYSGALKLIKSENPLSAVCGRVCFHPCEKSCNRKHYDQPVSIHAIERFVSDKGRNDYIPEPVFSSSGKTVAVVGSGPAGLSCAWHLARFGHSVTVFEKSDKPGGILRYGIPAYRLPKDVLDRELSDIQGLGVKFKCKTTIGRDKNWESLDQFDAVFIGVGCHKERPLFESDTPVKGLYASLEYLTLAAKRKIKPIVNRTIVIGGGNSAIDAARTARRMGNGVTVYYHRTEVEMPAFDEEIQDARIEGVEFEFLAKPLDIIVKKGEIHQVKFMKTRLGAEDASGRRRPIPVKGSEFYVDANTVITAIGEALDTDLLPEGLSGEPWKIHVDGLGATNLDKIYAGGDAALEEHNIAHAIGSGKAAACAIDAGFAGLDIEQIKDKITIGNTGHISAAQYILARAEAPATPISKHVPAFEKINTAYFHPQTRPEKKELSVQERLAGFDEVVQILSESAIQSETERCFHCGTCNQCDNCLTFCPDVSVMKRPDGTGYNIDLAYCKGCGICVNECPRSAMVMEEDK